MDCYSFPFVAMGTECLLHLYARTAAQADRAAQRAIDEMARIEGCSSPMRGNAPLAREEPENPRFPEFGQSFRQLDFGGIGKQYAADRVTELCLAEAIRHGLVDLGGDVRIIGPHPHGAPWHIGIRDPARPGNALTVFAADHSAIASRGGDPASGLVALSMVAECCLVAGSLSALAVLKGRAGITWLDGLGVDYLWVDDRGIRGGTLAAGLMASRRCTWG